MELLISDIAALVLRKTCIEMLMMHCKKQLLFYEVIFDENTIPQMTRIDFLQTGQSRLLMTCTVREAISFLGDH